MANAAEMNYVVGRGRLFFDRFPDSRTPIGEGEHYLGNTPSLQTTQANTDLKHYSSETGLKIMDASITLQKDITGTFSTDNISPDNLALWYSGAKSVLAQAATTGLIESFTVQPDHWYQIGVTDDAPLGVSSLASLTGSATVAVPATGTLTFAGQPTAADTVTINGVAITFVAGAPTGSQVQIGGNAAGTAQALQTYINAHPDTLDVTSSGASNVLTLTATAPGTGGNALTIAKSGANPTVSGATLAGGSAGSTAALTDDDWTVELDTGRFMIASDGGVTANSVVTVTYGTAIAEASLVITAETELFGSLRFLSDNPVGDQTDYFWPYIKLVSSGNYALKGDAWQEMTFSFDVLKLANRERVYMRTR